MGTAAQSAEQRLQAIDARLLQMRAWLPPRLSAALELPYRSLANPKLTLGERMQHTMTVINRCQQFNNAVACGEESIPVAGGEAKLMEVIYWGLSHGYALDRGAKTAYYGTPGDAGWSWAPAPELVSQVERLIAVNQDKTEPTFVEVPLKLRDPAALQPKS